MSETIMSVQELIDTAFPDEIQNCKINLRLLKTVVTIIANQLRLLNRRVQVSADSGFKRSQTSLHPSQVVSEIKIQVNNQENEETQKQGETGKADKRKKKKLKEGSKKTDEKKENDESQKEVDKLYPKTSKITLRFNADTGAETAGPVIQEGAIIHNTKVDDLEELREKEIRTINQRADSHEDPALSPSPMASVHSFAKESLLIVSPAGRTPRINVVTKDQFDELANIVHELEARLDPIGTPNFPENAELLKSLRAGASLTEAMAAFQMSARLQTFEKAFEIMLSLLTELAKNTSGVNVTRFRDLETNFAQGDLERLNLIDNCKSLRDDNEHVNDWVSRKDFDKAVQELHEEVVKMSKRSSKTTGTDNKHTELLISQLDQKIESLNYEERIEKVEREITEYAEQFIHLDIRLSSQIGSYQEQLTQMQYQLESGIENMVDKVTHVRSAPEALMEINVRLDALQQEIEILYHEQKELKSFQNNMTFDLARLWKEIELIRDAKADREEMFDALRDKAGIEHLNGMVSNGQFDAVCVELEAKINASYNKFNNQELVWQMALDDLARSIREKGDWMHICTLRDDINRHLNILNDKVETLMEVVGEPRAAVIRHVTCTYECQKKSTTGSTKETSATTRTGVRNSSRKKLFRDADCACCGTPATMSMEMPVPRLPEFKRASADGAEARVMPSEDGDHTGPCIPDRPVTHRDSRTHICHRFCGGSHTLIPRIPPPTRAPQGVTITHLTREVTTTIGSDGKAYLTDCQKELKPCKQCNAPKDESPSGNADEKKSKHVSDIGSSGIERTTSSFDIMGEMSWLAATKVKAGSDYGYPAPSSYDD